MKLDRLKEIARHDFPECHERIAENEELRLTLPGLLRVCDAYQRLLVAYAELDASRFGMGVQGDVKERAKKKIEELLG